MLHFGEESINLHYFTLFYSALAVTFFGAGKLSVKSSRIMKIPHWIWLGLCVGCSGLEGGVPSQPTPRMYVEMAPLLGRMDTLWLSNYSEKVSENRVEVSGGFHARGGVPEAWQRAIPMQEADGYFQKSKQDEFTQYRSFTINYADFSYPIYQVRFDHPGVQAEEHDWYFSPHVGYLLEINLDRGSYRRLIRAGEGSKNAAAFFLAEHILASYYADFMTEY